MTSVSNQIFYIFFYFLKNNPSKKPDNKQADKKAKGRQVTGTLTCSTTAGKKLSIQKCQDASSTNVTAHPPFQPAITLSNSCSEISLEGSSLKTNNLRQHLAIKSPALKSESSLGTKKNTPVR